MRFCLDDDRFSAELCLRIIDFTWTTFPLYRLILLIDLDFKDYFVSINTSGIDESKISLKHTNFMPAFKN